MKITKRLIFKKLWLIDIFAVYNSKTKLQTDSPEDNKIKSRRRPNKRWTSNMSFVDWDTSLYKKEKTFA